MALAIENESTAGYLNPAYLWKIKRKVSAAGLIGTPDQTDLWITEELVTAWTDRQTDSVMGLC